MLGDPVIIATRLSSRVFDIGVSIPLTHALIGDANVLVGLAAAQARQRDGSAASQRQPDPLGAPSLRRILDLSMPYQAVSVKAVEEWTLANALCAGVAALRAACSSRKRASGGASGAQGPRFRGTD